MLIREKTVGNPNVLLVYSDNGNYFYGTFEKMEDGYYWLFLDLGKNLFLCYSEWSLEQLAKELRARNAEWNAIVTKECSKPSSLAGV